MNEVNIKDLLEQRIDIILKNAHRRLRHRYKGVPLWSFISDMTSFGSTYSCKVCSLFNWNSSQEANKPIKIKEKSDD